MRPGLFRMMLGVGSAACLILLGAVMEGVHLSSLVAPTCLMIVLGGAIGFWFVGYEAEDIWSATRCIWSEPHEIAALERAQRVYHSLGQYLVITGIIATILGLMHVMMMLDQPEKIGPGIAVAFTGALYGFGFQLFIASPIADSFAARRTARSSQTKQPQLASPVVIASVNHKTDAASLDVQPVASTHVPAKHAVSGDEVRAMHAKIGELVMELDKKDHAA